MDDMTTEERYDHYINTLIADLRQLAAEVNTKDVVELQLTKSPSEAYAIAWELGKRFGALDCLLKHHPAIHNRHQDERIENDPDWAAHAKHTLPGNPECGFCP